MLFDHSTINLEINPKAEAESQPSRISGLYIKLLMGKKVEIKLIRICHGSDVSLKILYVENENTYSKVLEAFGR
jgi:hypothetical protein